MRGVLNLPRPIAPELLELGDKIRVTLRDVKGVRTILEGVIGTRTDCGAVRYFSTSEGGTLLAWTPGRTGVEILLLDRAPVNPEPFHFGTDYLIR